MKHTESSFKLVKSLNLLTEHFWPDRLYSRYNQNVFGFISIFPLSNVVMSLIWNDFRLIFNSISYLTLLISWVCAHKHTSKSQNFIKNYVQININIVFSLWPSHILSYHPILYFTVKSEEHAHLLLCWKVTEGTIAQPRSACTREQSLVFQTRKKVGTAHRYNGWWFHWS